ncbi:fatty-acid--CoA ligase [Marinobacter sp. F3R11]|nr:fatty-acid--CoA ligase [Marinobacter sp. F3R11]
MNITQPLHKALRECPDALAIVDGERRQNWRHLVSRIGSLAGGLQSLSMQHGDRVGMLARNSDHYIEYLYGVIWGGGVVNPVNIRWSAREIAYSLDDSDTRILLIDDTFLELLPAIREHSVALETIVFVGPGKAPEGTIDFEQLISTSAEVPDANRHGDDLAAILYTGGTTGQPKGVMLSHNNCYLGSIGASLGAPRPPRQAGLHAAPFFHVAGMQSMFGLSIRLGTHVVLTGFEPALVLRAIEEHGISEIFLVPTMLRMLLDHPDFGVRNLSSLESVRYGASPMDISLLERAMNELPGVDFSQAYGMTELAPTVAVLPPYYHTEEGRKAGKLRSAGIPTPVAEIRIVDPMDKELPNNTVGEIAVRGPMVMQGYWNKPEQTAEALRGGWMHTGDAGYMDDDGFLYVVDRIKDMVVTGGENVYSAEVENAILKLPQVELCAVFGVPDERWGERVHAAIKLRPGSELSEQQVTDHCKEHIASYKCPRSIEFVDEMPMSSAGKLLKFKMREPYWENQDRRVG